MQTSPNHLDLNVTIRAVELLEPLDVNYKVLLTPVDSRTKTGRDARKILEELKLPLFKAKFLVELPLNVHQVVA